MDNCSNFWKSVQQNKFPFLLHKFSIPFTLKELTALRLSLSLTNIFIITVSLHYIWTECPDGSYGHRCSLRCHDNCKTCGQTSGLCNGDCKIGWIGADCLTGKLCMFCWIFILGHIIYTFYIHMSISLCIHQNAQMVITGTNVDGSVMSTVEDVITLLDIVTGNVKVAG